MCWETNRAGNIRRASVQNARMALSILKITGVVRRFSADPGRDVLHVAYPNGGFAPIHYEVIRYLRDKINGACGYLPTYAAVERALEEMAEEAEQLSSPSSDIEG